MNPGSHPDSTLQLTLELPSQLPHHPRALTLDDNGQPAENKAAHGYYALLPNLYYQAGPVEPFDVALVFQTGPERDPPADLAAGPCLPAGWRRNHGGKAQILRRGPHWRKRNSTTNSCRSNLKYVG